MAAMQQGDERPIRMAASVICAREGADGLEVLVLRRSDGSRFLPGYVAFPGGAVDAGDGDHALRWFGAAAQAPRAAAVREVREEVGLAIVRDGLLSSAEPGFGEIDTAPPRASQLVEIARWVAPPEVPVRFDARYFAVAAHEGPSPVPDGHEVSDAWWVGPGRLLEEWRAGAHRLYWPTYFTVTQLARCRSVQDLLSLRFETRDPTPQEERDLPTHVMEQEPVA
jgi:8-oxo-dGTP pyrophosphatase MutT (NUDIX family)